MAFTGQSIDNFRFPLGIGNVGFVVDGFLREFHPNRDQVVDTIIHVINFLSKDREENIAGWWDKERKRERKEKSKE